MRDEGEQIAIFGMIKVYEKRAMGFEPTTSSLGSWHSTTELHPQVVIHQHVKSSDRVESPTDAVSDHNLNYSDRHPSRKIELGVTRETY